MRTKLKKAQVTGENETEIQRIQERLDIAQQQVSAAEAEKIAHAAAEGIDLKQLKIDAALAKAGVTKIERALHACESDEERTELTADLALKKETAQQLAQQLARFE